MGDVVEEFESYSVGASNALVKSTRLGTSSVFVVRERHYLFGVE
jgi:hypothetical protein